MSMKKWEEAQRIKHHNKTVGNAKQSVNSNSKKGNKTPLMKNRPGDTSSSTQRSSISDYFDNEKGDLT